MAGGAAMAGGARKEDVSGLELVRHALGAGIACLLVVGPVIAIELSEAGIRDAVVIQDGVLARSGPAEMYDPAFKESLRPGVECRIFETRSQWLLIGLWDGRRAWVPASSVELTAAMMAP